MNNNTNDENLQGEILEDIRNGREYPWRLDKTLGRPLSMAYYSLSYETSNEEQPKKWHNLNDVGESVYYYKRALAVEGCGSFLEFKEFEDGTKKLHNARFCKIPLCPMCAGRRSLKTFGQVSRIMDEMENTTDYDYIFSTLTQRNVYAYELKDEISRLFEAYKDLNNKRKEFKAMSKGWFRALEVTHDTEEFITKKMYYKRRKYYDKRGLKAGDPNPNFDMYHPHFHVIIAVNKSYFTSKEYISTKKWVQLWRSCLGVDYDPIVHVQKVVKGSKVDGKVEEIGYGKAIAEVSKYSTKSGDFLVEGNRDLTNSAVYTLDKALKGRRLIGFGGKFRELHKKLNLDDAHNGDLIHVGDDEQDLRPDIDYIIKRYCWNIGYNNYFLHTESDKGDED